MIFVNFLGYVLHLLAKGWVTDQLPYTFYRIPLPQVKHLTAQLAILIPLVTSDFERLANPFGTSWKCVYTTVECALVLE
jgi:hypothetical protein